MDNGNTQLGSGSLQIGVMDQAWINTSAALSKVQVEATNSILTNSQEQEKMNDAMIKMSQDSMQTAVNSYDTFRQQEEKAKHASFWQTIFGDIVGALIAAVSVAVGQPELAVLSIALLVGQQTGVTEKLEKAISPDSAMGRLFVGLAIMVVCTAVGGVGASVREGSALGGSLLAGSQALGSVGIQSNVGELLPDSGAALGISCALMVVSLIGGVAGGKLSLASADFSSLGAKMAQLTKTSTFLMAAGQAGQAGTGFANGAFMYQQSNSLEIANTANALSSLINNLRDQSTAQGKAFMQAMQEVATTAAKEGVAVAKGMVKSNQWAAQLVAHA